MFVTFSLYRRPSTCLPCSAGWGLTSSWYPTQGITDTARNFSPQTPLEQECCRARARLSRQQTRRQRLPQPSHPGSQSPSTGPPYVSSGSDGHSE